MRTTLTEWCDMVLCEMAFRSFPAVDTAVAESGLYLDPLCVREIIDRRAFFQGMAKPPVLAGLPGIGLKKCFVFCGKEFGMVSVVLLIVEPFLFGLCCVIFTTIGVACLAVLGVICEAFCAVLSPGGPRRGSGFFRVGIGTGFDLTLDVFLLGLIIGLAALLDLGAVCRNIQCCRKDATGFTYLGDTADRVFTFGKKLNSRWFVF